MSSRPSGPARCARRSASRTPSRTNRSWTSSRRKRKPIRWNFACATSAMPRLRDVVKGAASAANWDARPLRNVPPAASAILTGRGISCVAYEGENGYAAMVAEVEVERATGIIRVQRDFRVRRLRPDLQSRRAQESDRRRHAAGREPRALSRKSPGTITRSLRSTGAPTAPTPSAFPSPQFKS